MIISCNNCNKNFEINSNLIPIKGRLLQCSACDHRWFFKDKAPINAVKNDNSNIPTSFDTQINQKNDEPSINEVLDDKNISNNKEQTNKNLKYKDKKSLNFKKINNKKKKELIF